MRVALMIRYAGRCCCACVVWPRCPPTSKRRARFRKRLVQLGGAQELGRRRPPLGGGGRAATARPPPAVAARRPTLKRDTSTVLDAAHVDGLTSNLGAWHAQRSCYRAPPPRKKKGPSQGSTGSHCRFAQLLSIAPTVAVFCTSTRGTFVVAPRSMAAAELSDAELCLALPSDTELALQILWANCPPGALVASGRLQAALRSQVYGIVNDRTAVDRELERLRLAGSLRVLQLPSARDELLLISADQYFASLAESATLGGPLVAAAAKSRATALVVSGLSDRAIEALASQGWCVLKPPVRAGPDEAPPAPVWVWSVPQCGALASNLLTARREVLKALGRHRLGCAPRVVVERSVAKKLREVKLDLSFVLRELVGTELLTIEQHHAGSNLALTADGRTTATSAAAKGKRKR